MSSGSGSGREIPGDVRRGGGNRLLGLELIRFSAALAVLVWHYQHFSYVGATPMNFVREEQPFYPLLSLFYNFGHFGVQVFWTISGFIFFWKYRDLIANRIVDGKKFFVLRFSRLYPLHIATLCIVALLQLLYFHRHQIYFVYPVNDLLHFVYQLFFASNWGFQQGDSFNGPIWSISVEVVVYCIFFLTLRFISRSALVNIAVVALWLAATKAHFFSQITECLLYFYLGGFTAIASKYLDASGFRKQLTIVSALLAVSIPVAVVCCSLYRIRNFDIWFLKLYVPILLLAVARDIAVGPLVSKWIIAAGNMTYASYLFQFPLQLLIVSCFDWSNTPIPYHSPYFFLAFMASVLTASFYIYRHFEMPAQDAIRKKLSAAATPSRRVWIADNRALKG